MTVKKKLVTASILIIILVIFVGTALALGYRDISYKTDIAYQLDKETMYLQMMLRGLNEVILNEGTPDSIGIARNALNGFDSIHIDLLSRVKNPYVLEKLKHIYPVFNEIRIGVEPYLANHYFDLDDEVLLIRYGSLIRKTEQISDEINLLANNTKRELDSSQKNIVYIISLFSSFILIIIGFYVFRLYKSITHPIEELLRIADGFSEGDLSVLMDESKNDEFGSLARHFNTATMELNHTTQMLNKSESRFRSVIESANDAIVSLDNRGEIIFWNQAAEKIFGYSYKEVIGKSVTMCMPERFRNAHSKGVYRLSCISEQKVVGNTVELIGLRNDGTEFPLELSLARWNVDEEHYYTGIVRDITDRKKSETALEKSQATIIQQEKMSSIGQLAGGIAHDFNNILSVINGYSELALKDMEEDSPFREHISTIHAAGEKASSLTKELLAFSRKQPLEMNPSNMNTTIDNIENILMRLIGENIRLDIIKNKDLKNVLADRTQLEQVLMNLAVNARDAMPHGGDIIIKTLNVYFKREFYMGNENVKPGPYTMLSVRDTGEGMSKEVKESIFEPFFSTKEIGKGTGMGLATVYGIIKQHGGYISVHSKIGGGTVFKVYIPATDKEIEEETTIDAHDLKGNETILVVDDEHLLTGLVVEMLDPLGYNVLAALNGEEAMKVCNNFNDRIDLLLTDVMMPGMNGRELAEKFAVKRPDTKVIYMSGYTDDAIVHHGVLVDGVVLVNKPIKSDVIASKIREVLGTRPHQSDHQKADEKLHGIHILLADDNADIRNLIQIYLKNYASIIDTAENGEIAVEKFTSGWYDIILMDMQMPVMDGLTATKEIRKREEETGSGQTKIVALTGNASNEEIEKCLRAGCSSHLAKPINKDTLVHALVSNMPVKKNDVSSNEEILQEKEERFVAHVDTDLKDLIPEYLEERLHDMNRIQEAIKSQDYEAVRILGHTLKGSGGGYGFDPISEIGMHIEGAANEGNEKEIEKWNNKLSDYIDNVDIIYE